MVDVHSGTVVQRHEIQLSSNTALQVTDLNYDCWQTITRRFQQIHVQWQMWFLWKVPPTKAQTSPRSSQFFRQSVLHQWPIAAKPTSAVPSDGAARDVQFQENSWDENRDTLEKELWSPRREPLIIDWSPDRQIANLCAAPHMNLKLGLQSNKSCSIYGSGYILNW